MAAAITIGSDLDVVILLLGTDLHTFGNCEKRVHSTTERIFSSRLMHHAAPMKYAQQAESAFGREGEN